MSKSIGIALVAATVLLRQPVTAQEKVVLKVLGQPTDAGEIQKNKEQPFFTALGKRLGPGFVVEYVPADHSNVAEKDQLKALRAGRIQIASLRISQVGGDVPEFLGMDLLGMNTNFSSGRRATDAYLQVLDKTLQRRYDLKLFGVWPFGPQYLFCGKALAGLSDLKSRKVRVYDANLAKFVETAGGTPVQLAFADTRQALAAGKVDCAVTSPTSAASAGWIETAKYVVPIAFQLGINAYAMPLNTWIALTKNRQRKLTPAIQELVEGMWTYSRQLSTTALECGAGQGPCLSRQSRLTEVPVGREDVRLMRKALWRISLSAWAKTCDMQDSACSAAWKKSVGPVVGAP